MELGPSQYFVIGILLLVLDVRANDCVSDDVLAIARFPCTPHHRRRFLGTTGGSDDPTSIGIAHVGNMMYGLLSNLITKYRTRHYIPENIIQRSDAVPLYVDPRVSYDGEDFAAIVHAVQVYFAELHTMQTMETRLRVDLYEKHTYEGVIRICQQTSLTLLCRLQAQMTRAGSPGLQATRRSSLHDVTCPESEIIEYMAKSIHTLENMREYFRLMAMVG